VVKRPEYNAYCYLRTQEFLSTATAFEEGLQKCLRVLRRETQGNYRPKNPRTFTTTITLAQLKADDARRNKAKR
jgi:hypothetical protein